MTPTSFTSVHDYLEFRFRHMETISDDMVKEAKAEYRKLYLSEYYKTYRESHIQITFRVSKKQYAYLFKQAKEQGIKVTKYIKQLALKPNEQPNTFKLKSKLLLIRDMIEEAIEEQEQLDKSELLLLAQQMLKELT